MPAFPSCRIMLLASSMVLITLSFTADGAADSAPIIDSVSNCARCGRSPDRATTLPVVRSGDRPQREPSGIAEETTSAGKCYCTANAFHRAGHPETVSRLAIPSSHCHYGGYYVGGGLPIRGEERCVFHDGTWGWDYFGILFPKKIALNWGHGLRHQGGAGAYKTDGPKLRHE